MCAGAGRQPFWVLLTRCLDQQQGLLRRLTPLSQRNRFPRFGHRPFALMIKADTDTSAVQAGIEFVTRPKAGLPQSSSISSLRTKGRESDVCGARQGDLSQRVYFAATAFDARQFGTFPNLRGSRVETNIASQSRLEMTRVCPLLAARCDQESCSSGRCEYLLLSASPMSPGMPSNYYSYTEFKTDTRCASISGCW